MGEGENSVRAVLEASSYRSLFESEGGDAPTRGMDSGVLAEIVADGDDLKTSFLAAEILARTDSERWRKLPRPRLAQLYVGALRLDLVGSANAWGLPGRVGLLGQRLQALGADVLPTLGTLLTNKQAVHYAGSEDAARANEMGLRIADLAGFYYGLIAVEMFDVTSSVEDRDAMLDYLAKHAAGRN